MIKIMIVDDERHIVNHFAMLLEKEQQYAFDVIKAYSGVEALDIVRQTNVHIILLDIKMPRKNGLEVAREVSGLWPRTKIIFLTSAECFEYIYEIKNFKNACYLLKMESDEKICSRIYECVEEILQEQRHSRLIEETQKKTVIMEHFLNDNILRDLLYGYTPKDIENTFHVSGAEMQLSFEKPVFMSLMQVDKTFRSRKKSNMKDWMDYVENMEALSDEYFQYALIEVERNLYLWLMQPVKEDEEAGLSFARLKCLMEDFQEGLYENLHYYTQIVIYPEGIGWDRFNEVQETLQEYYSKDMKGQLQSALIKYDSALESIKAGSLPGEGERQEIQSCEELRYYLNKYDFKEYIRKFEEIKKADCFRGGIRNNLKADACYMSIALILVNFTEQCGLKKEVSGKISLSRIFSLEGYSDWNDVFRYLDRVNEAVFEAVEKNKENKRQKTMRAIKDYIQANLDQNITLFSISQVVCYNEAYISRIFKQHEGIGIFEYITAQRVAYARNLLINSELTIQEIACRAGFTTSQYFSVVFKKKLGMSPAEYRNIHKK